MTGAAPRHRLVSVIGAGQVEPLLYEQARETGARLAAAGLTVVTGGLGGVMEAASRGAAEAGGLSIGLLPGERHEDANPWVHFAIPTGLGDARNVLVAVAGLGVIAVAGEVGTLSEMALALRRGLPVISLGSWELDPSRLHAGRVLLRADTPEQAVKLLLEQLNE